MTTITPISLPPGAAAPMSAPTPEAMSRVLHAQQAASSPEHIQAATAVVQPQKAAAENAPHKANDAAELQEKLDQTMAESKTATNLKFVVDQDIHRVVVSIVNSENGETIMQIPNEAALAVARQLADTGSGLFSKEA